MPDRQYATIRTLKKRAMARRKDGHIRMALALEKRVDALIKAEWDKSPDNGRAAEDAEQDEIDNA